MASTEPQLTKVKEAFKKVVDYGGHDTVLKDVEIVSVKEGAIVAEMVVCKEHCNIFNTLHGGLIATLIDVLTSFAMAIHPNKGNGVSVDLNITYLRKAGLNEEIVIAANTTKIGSTIGFSEATITSKKTGDVIARGLHTKFVGDSKKYIPKNDSVNPDSIINQLKLDTV